MSAASRRKLADISALSTSYKDKCPFIVNDSNSHIETFIFGPEDTPYSGKKWKISIDLPIDYPFKPPEVKFIDRIFHPNISAGTGTICLDVIKNKWTPVFNLLTIIDILIPQLLTYPNPDSALNGDASHAWREGLDFFTNAVNHFHLQNNSTS